MFKNLIFYAIVTIAMFYLLLTSPSKVDEVCSEAAAVVGSITEVVTATVTIPDDEKDDIEKAAQSTEASTNIVSTDLEMTPKQRTRREEIMTNLTEVFDSSSFPDIQITDTSDTADSSNEFAARLENVREQMDRIYLQNSFER